MTAYDRCIQKLDLISVGLRDIRENNRNLRFHMNLWALAMAVLILASVPVILMRMA